MGESHRNFKRVNYLLKLKIYFILFLSVIFCANIYAAPHIDSIEGQVSNGSEITIRGSDFGSNGPAIAIFDDFEKGKDEQNITVGDASVATVGRWDGFKFGGSQIFFSNDYAHSGNLAYQGRSGPGYSGDGIAIIRNFPATKEIFSTWWVYFPDECEWPWTPENSYGWKQVWFHSNGNHQGSDFIVNTIPWPNGGSLVAGNFAGGYVHSGYNMPKGQWVRMRVHWIGGGSNNGSINIHYLNYNGSNREVEWINETNVTNMSNGNDNYRLVELGAWSRVHPTTVAKMIFDDFYVATGPNARARVEIGNQPVYQDCTNLAIITPTNWRNNAITATVRAGSFQSGEAYLFVVDANGNVSNGLGVKINGNYDGEGGGADTTPPEDVVGFAAQPGNGQVGLSWTNPDDSDFVGTMVRYRTDGQYPLDHNDGTEICNETGAPGLSGGCTHENAQNGTTYFYSAFTYDAAGNYSQTAHVSATPMAADGGDEVLTRTFGDTPGANFPGTIEDTYINLNSNANGSGAQLNTYTWPANMVANAILMKVDLSQMPANTQIQSASLQLYQTDAGGDSSYDLSIHNLVNHKPNLSSSTGYTYDGANAWTANSQCYNDIPMAQADIAGTDSTVSLNTAAGYKSLDITNMVREWVANPSSNYGLLINSDVAASANSYRYFASSEAADANQRPKLVVVYSVDMPGGEPSAPNWK